MTLGCPFNLFILIEKLDYFRLARQPLAINSSALKYLKIST
jgi:hypothetical protein